jgi:hypothetical protein
MIMMSINGFQKEFSIFIYKKRGGGRAMNVNLQRGGVIKGGNAQEYLEYRHGPQRSK